MERNSLAASVATSVAASFADAAPATLDIVAAAWATALRRPAVDRDADFRALGLNANRAMRMMRDLWTETGRELPVNALLEYPTIRRLAAAIDDGRAFTAADLVLLSPARHDRPGIEPAPPLFLFGGFGGFLLDLTDLAKAIDAGCAVYGVGPAGADGATAPHLTYDGETAHARAAIKRVQPAGPYRLAGYSSGGIVALETARLMRAHGDAGRLRRASRHQPRRSQLAGRTLARLPWPEDQNTPRRSAAAATPRQNEAGPSVGPRPTRHRPQTARQPVHLSLPRHRRARFSVLQPVLGVPSHAALQPPPRSHHPDARRIPADHL